jgi:hypothetical protein
MTQNPKQRGARRFLVAERLGARAGATLEVRIVDLSATGARIEHAHPLTPGSVCTFEFPPTLGGLILSARIVHSMALTDSASTEGGGVGQPRFQSGLIFVGVTAEQQAVLAATLERLTSGIRLEDRRRRP